MIPGPALPPPESAGAHWAVQAVLLAAVAVASFAAMEIVAWASHKYLMHGPLWFLHRSHHAPRGRGPEANDLFGILFSLPSILLCVLGAGGRPLLLGAGMGMAAYGLAYLAFHDALVHGRFGRVRMPKDIYLARIVKAHRLHHARSGKKGAVCFGFLWAPAGPSARQPLASPSRPHSPGWRRSPSAGG